MKKTFVKRIYLYGLSLVITFISLMLLYFVLTDSYIKPDTMSLLVLIVFTLSLLSIIINPRIKIFGFTGIYFLYLSISHLGLDVSHFFSEDVLQVVLPSHNYMWYFSDEKVHAVAISGIAIAVFILSSNYTSLIMGKNNEERSVKEFNKKQLKGNFYNVGMMLLIISILYFTIMNLTGKFNSFGTYSLYRENVSLQSRYKTIIFLLGIGINFVVATGSRKQIIKGLILFFILSIFLFSSGNRGEILYPAASAYAVYNIRSKRINTKLILLWLIIILMIVPLVKDMRHINPEERSLKNFTFSLYSPFAQMGFQLRPLTNTVMWIESGEEYARGMTYIIPIQRQIALVTPFISRMDYNDPKYARVNVKARTPRQGYSVIAEAFFNFGIFGVIFIMATLGFILYYFGEKTKNLKNLALMGGFTSILINNIRNVFAFVPGQVIILLFLVLISQVKIKKHEK